VWQAVHKLAKTPVAIKLVNKKKLKKSDNAEITLKLMMNEMKTLEETNHPNIPKIYELFEDKQNYCIVMELITGGNMEEKLEQRNVLSESHVAKVIEQVLLALNYMHKKNIIHRDIKLQNLLCMPEKTADQSEISIKLADFGFATVMKEGKKMKMPLGTP
jgi:serine/threonine protein kinase